MKPTRLITMKSTSGMCRARFLYRVALLLTSYAGTVTAGNAEPTAPSFTNSLGMTMQRIESGAFMMGADGTPLPVALTDNLPHRTTGDFDEFPAHSVTITQPFHIATTEVTNEQFEQFDPNHRTLRGKRGFSKADDEAVVFVTWHDAVRFCEWLSEKEGKPYRLPTEAEWEYACRAGTTAHFHTGDTLPEVFHNNQRLTFFPEPTRVDEGRRFEDDIVPIPVGQTPPNPWGLYDMHGNVEEWCSDWYGPYNGGAVSNPVGRVHGDFKVTRGGSHSTELYFLRSANRMGTLPEDSSWLIGFRVVQGEAPKSAPLPMIDSKPLNQRDVLQTAGATLTPYVNSKPYFVGPRRYLKIAPDAYGPLYGFHNHVPGIAACPNGDLLAIWYTCVRERGRELALAASRLRVGAEQWEPASPFWDAPDRNDHAPTIWFDGEQTLYLFAGLSASTTWGSLAMLTRTSTDSGATWSPAQFIDPEHAPHHSPTPTAFRTRDGALVLTLDAHMVGPDATSAHGSELFIQDPDSKEWHNPGGSIKGVHAGAAELSDGRLMALGRGNNIDGKMPKSISDDGGKTWTYSTSPFPPIHNRQRLVLLRLREGPLLLVSFAGKTIKHGDLILDAPIPELGIIDGTGNPGPCRGMFAALSYDDGETWPVRRLVTPGGPAREAGRMDNHPFTLSDTMAEPSGYLSACQGLDGTIHLITSNNHYAFNMAWLTEHTKARQ